MSSVSSRRGRRALLLLAGAGALALAWLTAGPSQLGGPVSYAIVSGSSMEPNLHRGDLVVVRAARAYDAGDVVAYRTDNGATVLHRVIGRAGAGYLVQGDNNSWVDPYQPTEDNIVGRLRWRIPTVGRLLDWLREPLPFSVTVGLLSFAVGARYARREAVPA